MAPQRPRARPSTASRARQSPRLDEERGSRAGLGRRRGDSHATVRSSRRGRRRGGALTGRRVALVLVPILLVLAGAIAWGSSLTRVPKHGVDSAATVRPTQPTTTASTIADAPAATPPPAARHSAKAAPKHRAAHVKAATRTKRPSTASTHHIVVARHVAAPTIAPRPTYVATRVPRPPLRATRRRAIPRQAPPLRARHLAFTPVRHRRRAPERITPREVAGYRRAEAAARARAGQSAAAGKPPRLDNSVNRSDQSPTGTMTRKSDQSPTGTMTRESDQSPTGAMTRAPIISSSAACSLAGSWRARSRWPQSGRATDRTP